MTLGSLFDGISGFPLAASWAGIETKWISEIDPYCLKVSKKNFPNAIQYGDIKEIHQPESVDIISGGFPCQPFSVAGRQQGKEDYRYLWPEMLRVIREAKPRWVIGENVPGIINLALDEVLTSLENEGYKTETFIIPACAVGAWHRRDRVWIIALSDNVSNSSCTGLERTQFCSNHAGETTEGNEGATGAITECNSHAGVYWAIEPELGRVANGISNRVDRIKALGNAIVPQVAFEIFKAIVEIENNKH